MQNPNYGNGRDLFPVVWKGFLYISRTKLNNIEMQGTVLTGLKCAISIDSIGKEALENKHDICMTIKIR